MDNAGLFWSKTPPVVPLKSGEMSRGQRENKELRKMTEKIATYESNEAQKKAFFSPITSGPTSPKVCVCSYFFGASSTERVEVIAVSSAGALIISHPHYKRPGVAQSAHEMAN